MTSSQERTMSLEKSLLHIMRQEISDNRAFHDRLQNIQQQVDDLREQTRYDRQQALEESQEEVLTAQQRTIDRLVTIQDPCTSKRSTKGATVSPRIHFARHKGYDLEMTAEFFMVYGDYIKAITYILKNGIAAPGINIPSVSHLMLADGIDEVREELDLDSQSIQSLMVMTNRALLVLMTGTKTESH
ncbi:hypothetical protein BGZ65_007540 [Modicella reniformis]|uniref:Uncharacterized protein n=1 Tax=Modicella reniformis TaxID=1440133 RepID=A0A9P6SSF0_9FUNG|nr:hypothetical protein BGZ65_007540 [Modicella reniformis]